MSKSSSFNELTACWGSNRCAINKPYSHALGVGIPTARTRRNAMKFILNTRRKVIGRAYRVYSQIRRMEGF